MEDFTIQNIVPDLPANYIYDYILHKLQSWGVGQSYLNFFSTSILIAVFILVQLGLDWLIKNVMMKLLIRQEKRASSSFVRFLFRNKTFEYLVRLIPLIVSLEFLPTIFSGFPGLLEFFTKVVDVLLLLGWIFVVRAVLQSGRDYFISKPAFKNKPLDSYLQVIVIILYIVGLILMVARFTEKSPIALLTGLGAASAILMLVFKDTILGFVASIQVSTNDMVRVGDWIEMPKYNADGEVLEINLNTVKVQNWDKTITTIPTYYLITDSFKNWRGMQDSGGRRIKRSIFIKMASIHFVSAEEIENLKKVHFLSKYINDKELELSKYNSEHHLDVDVPVNGRHLTNVGLFRIYANTYLENHPKIRKDMTLLVRQLQPTEHGLPLELYMFTADTRWAIYEGIMSDIFDHLLASVKYFNLEVFEAPASDDIRGMKKEL